MTRECKQQFTLRIAQANSTEMVAILYEMVLVYIEEGAQAHALQDRGAFREAVRKIRGCLYELLRSLNPEYEPAPAILQLLLYCIRRLAIGELKNDIQPLLEIKKVAEPLREAFGQLAQQNTGGPVMGNSQTVYAGLTYGRNTLTENMTDQGANRGMRV